MTDETTIRCSCGRWSYINDRWKRASVTTRGNSISITVLFPAGNERNRCIKCRDDLTTSPEATK